MSEPTQEQLDAEELAGAWNGLINHRRGIYPCGQHAASGEGKTNV